MTTIKESREPAPNDLEHAVEEYWESIQRTIELESSKLKEKVEQDSAQIITEAKEEAKKTVNQAKQEARLEAERIIDEAKEEAKKTVDQARKEAKLEAERFINEVKEEAEQAVREYRKEACAEALQESERVIGDTKDKISKSIAEIIEHSITQVKEDFTRVASEARSELENGTSKILIQAHKIVEEISDETKLKTDSRVESEPPAVDEDETKGQQGTKFNDDDDEVSPQQVTGGAIKVKTPTREETDPSIPATGEKLDVPIEHRDDNRLFEGRLKVEIVHPAYTEQQWDIRQDLAQVPGLKVISTESYARGANWVLAHTIELERPTQIMKTIKSSMRLKDIAEYKGNIVVMAK